VKTIAATLEDFGDPWPATTLPTHDWSPGRPEET
jgi:hypothetical protein